MADSRVSTVYLLKRAELAVRGCVEVAFGSVGLTPSQYFILYLVKSGEATSSAELAREMGVLPQSMREIIAPLEEKAAIVRRPDAANKRILRVELTPSGERLFEKATEVAIKIERELLASFDERDVAHMNRLFGALITTAEAHSYHPKLRRLGKPAARTKAAIAARASARGRAANVK